MFTLIITLFGYLTPDIYTYSPPDYECPINKCQVVNEFIIGTHNWDVGHRGVDLTGNVASPVYAAQTGEVIYAGQLNDRKIVSIQHANGIRTTYEPINPTVKKGELVSKGKVIGTLMTGHCQKSCLHWGAKTGADNYINPHLLLSHPKVRLLE